MFVGGVVELVLDVDIYQYQYQEDCIEGQFVNKVEYLLCLFKKVGNQLLKGLYVFFLMLFKKGRLQGLLCLVILKSELLVVSRNY